MNTNKISVTPIEIINLRQETPPPLPTQTKNKHPASGNFLLGFFLTPHQKKKPPVRSGRNLMKGAECSESNGKNNKKILRYLFFELSKIGAIFKLK